MPSCASLPDWPTLAQVEAAGFIDDVSGGTVVVGTLLSIGGLLCVLPQLIKFVRVRSTLGASGFTIVLAMMSKSMQCATLVASESPKFASCGKLSAYRCFSNTLASQQLILQAIGNILVFVFYAYYYWRGFSCQNGTSLLVASIEGSTVGSTADASGLPAGANLEGSRINLHTRSVCLHTSMGSEDYTPPPSGALRRRDAAVGVCSFALSVGAVPALLIVAFVAGPCADCTWDVLKVVGIIATVLQATVWLPQIYTLCVLKQPGSLSMLMLSIQCIGNYIFTVDLLLEQAQIVAVLPFLVLDITQTLALVLAIYYHRCATHAALPESL